MSVIPSECPMHAEYKPKPAADSTAPSPAAPAAATVASTSAVIPSECPMSADYTPKGESSDTQASVAVDPANMMPPANQQPSPGQPFSLDTSREVSSIPRGGTDHNWVYPSEQMWWNAALRKGWRWDKDDVTADTMKSIIQIHNVNNELAWNEVLHWERFMGNTADDVKLKKFGGKASDYSPRARFRAALGYGLPFDRHDWIVDRGGREVRYIIDYYDMTDEQGNPTDGIWLDTRPAFDSFDAAFYRSKAFFFRWAFRAGSWVRSMVNSDSSSSSSTAT